MDRLKEALAIALKATELRPNEAKAYAEAGLLLDRDRKPREAVEYLRKAVSLAPHRAAHYDELGMALHCPRKILQYAVWVDVHATP